MPETNADVLLHPVRLRIVQAVEMAKRCTVQQLQRMLPDVPQASLYRHLNRLVEAGFVEIVEERPVGGALERVYALVEGKQHLTGTDLAAASPEDHMRYFTAFCALLMAKFSKYLQREHIDYEADGVGYRLVSLYLSDDEFLQLVNDLNQRVRKAQDNEPTLERRLRLFASIVMPECDVVPNDE